MKIVCENDCAFWTDSYGAFRWDTHLQGRPGTWYLVSTCPDFDYMRGLVSAHITCVVDDFGNLVKVPS